MQESQSWNIILFLLWNLSLTLTNFDNVRERFQRKIRSATTLDETNGMCGNLIELVCNTVYTEHWGLI